MLPGADGRTAVLTHGQAGEEIQRELDDSRPVSALIPALRRFTCSASSRAVPSVRQRWWGLFAERDHWDMPKAYWVNTFRSISDPEKLARYAELAGAVMTDHGGRFLARGVPVAAYESGLIMRTTVIEFPSVADAIAAYESPEYRTALEALDSGAVRDIRIVPGLEEEVSSLDSALGEHPSSTA